MKTIVHRISSIFNESCFYFGYFLLVKIFSRITKNNVDHCEMDNGTESRNPITKAQNM